MRCLHQGLAWNIKTGWAGDRLKHAVWVGQVRNANLNSLSSALRTWTRFRCGTDGDSYRRFHSSLVPHWLEFCRELCELLEPPASDPFSAGTTCSLIVLIQSHCNSSAALALLFGSRSKHLFKKSIPGSLSCSRFGSCGGFPCAILYMIAHSLSRLAQGRRPVLISRMTQPRDQMSIAPRRPSLTPLMTSGDMYIGVPVMDFCFAGALGRAGPPAARGASFGGWRVLFWRAITLAAPKSTYLMTPL